MHISRKKYYYYLFIALLILNSILLFNVKVEAKSSEFIVKNGVLTNYQGNSKKVVIPKHVKIIGESAFWKSEITEVVIPKTVKEIGVAVLVIQN